MDGVQTGGNTGEVDMEMIEASLADLDFDLDVDESEPEVAEEEIIEDVGAEPMEAAEVIEEEVSEEAGPEEIAAEVNDEEAAAVAAADELGDLDLNDLELTPEDEAAIERVEAYDSQESDSDVVTEVQPVAAASAPAAAKRARRASGGTRTVIKGDVSKLDPKLFVLSSAAEPADLDANKQAVIASRPKQVKVAEKFDKLFLALDAGRPQSRYVDLAFEYLEQHKTFSQADLVKHYACSMGEGTARAQAGQIMVLFDVLGIASRTKQTLTTLPHSKIAERLRAQKSA